MVKKFIKFSKFFFISLGIIFSTSLIILLFYGDTSKQRRNLIFNTINSFIGVGSKYDTFIANTPSKYFKIIYYNIKNRFLEFPYYSLNIKINQNNLNELEELRSNKFKFPANDKKNVNAKIEVYKKDDDRAISKVKIRLKGDREIHFLNSHTMSYKIDVKNGEEFILGMEEMSLQKPIVRNYAWEILYHDLLKAENVLALDIFPVKLYRNNKYLGIFVLEEGFDKELLFKQSRKNGPIIGIDEELSEYFPGLQYDYYSQNYWLNNNKDLFFESQSKLNEIKKNYNEVNFNIFEYFDLEKWAKFFALTDVLQMYHGAVTKSVKLYYNPETLLFEPIAFDGHHGSGYINFSLVDFIFDQDINCGYLCGHNEWLKLFFDKKNKFFLERFLFELKYFSSDEFEIKIENKLQNKINLINKFFYSEYQSADRVFYKGFLPYYFDAQPIYQRNIKIRDKIKFIESYLKKYYEN
tara:strand:- start:1087 stop:2484 length:1398 start_codon:yes stop_codon:yes gene_type:complete